MLYNPEWKAPQKEKDPIADGILKAADLIRTKGHTKWAQVNSEGEMCAHGALIFAFTGEFYSPSYSPRFPEYLEACKRVAEYLGPQPGVFGGTSFAGWNNLAERTKEEVIAALEGAAAHVVQS